MEIHPRGAWFPEPLCRIQLLRKSAIQEHIHQEPEEWEIEFYCAKSLRRQAVFVNTAAITPWLFTTHHVDLLFGLLCHMCSFLLTSSRTLDYIILIVEYPL